MPVTELAILHSLSGGLTEELREQLTKAQPIQDKWVAEVFPGSATTASGARGAMYQQIEEPAKVLITAQWESAAQHEQWIGSEPNKQVMTEVMSKVVTEGDNSVVLLHFDDDVFGSQAPAGHTHLLDSPIISVGRIFVQVDNKADFQTALDSGIQILKNFASPYVVHGGWRVDKEDESKEEYIMLVGWDSVDKHMAFAASPDFLKYAGIRQFTTGADIKHYKRFA